MAFGGKIALSGFDEYLAKVQAAGNSVDDATKKAIDASTEFLKEEMEPGFERHKRTGEVLAALDSEPVKQTGNYIYGRVGIIPNKSPEAWTAVFQEYGSPTFPADPVIRPAFEQKAKVRSIQREVLKEEGVPIE